jgi:hypothetical protein
MYNHGCLLKFSPPYGWKFIKPYIPYLDAVPHSFHLYAEDPCMMITIPYGKALGPITIAIAKEMDILSLSTAPEWSWLPAKFHFYTLLDISNFSIMVLHSIDMIVAARVCYKLSHWTYKVINHLSRHCFVGCWYMESQEGESACLKPCFRIKGDWFHLPILWYHQLLTSFQCKGRRTVCTWLSWEQVQMFSVLYIDNTPPRNVLT